MSETRRKNRAHKEERPLKEEKPRRGRREKPKSQGGSTELEIQGKNKPKLQRQNSATLRKYGDVYESLHRQHPKGEKGEKKEKDVEKLDKKLKKLEVKAKKESKKDEEKPKRKLNPYQIFFKEKRLAGKTPEEIGELWKRHKENN